MSKFESVSGIVTEIEVSQVTQNDHSGCVMRMTLTKRGGEITNFIIDPTTYFLNNVTLQKGDKVTAFYDTNVPVILIYPPQFRAVFVARNHSNDRTITLDFFDRDLVSSDGKLKLNLSPRTKILLTNNQRFLGSPANHLLAVVYSRSTKSIPAMTTPVEVVVFCS